MPILDLATTFPTEIPEVLRTIAQDAACRAADPLNALDDNPVICREWLIASIEITRCAEAMETHFAEGLSVRCRAPRAGVTPDPC